MSAPPGGGLEVLRAEPQFRLLFLGQVLSALGDRMTQVVLPFAVLSVGGSVTDVGLVAAAGFAPFLVLGLVAGVLADRADRRAMLVASDLTRLGCQLAGGVLLVTGRAEVWHLAALGAVFGAADACFAPAFAGLVPQTLTDRSRLQAANALRALTYSGGSILGPVLAGLVVAVSGPGVGLLADAATFAVSVGCLALLRPTAVEREGSEPFLHGLRDGWREVRRRRWVQSFLGATAVYHAVVLPSIFVLGPVLADRELGGAGAWGVIVAAFGAGAIIADLALLRLRPRRALRAAAAGLVVASCQAVIIGSGLPLAAIAAVEVVAAMGVSTFFTLWETSLQEHIPERALSRVASYDYAASVGMMPVGMVAAGPVSEALGLHATLAAMSLVGVASALGCLALPAVRTLPRGGAAAPGTAPPAPGGP